MLESSTILICGTDTVNLGRLHNPVERPEGNLRATGIYDGIIILFSRMTSDARTFAAALLGDFLLTQRTEAERGAIARSILANGRRNIGHTFFATTVFPEVVRQAAAVPDCDVVYTITSHLHDLIEASIDKNDFTFTEKRVRDFLNPASLVEGYLGQGTWSFIDSLLKEAKRPLIKSERVALLREIEGIFLAASEASAGGRTSFATLNTGHLYHIMCELSKKEEKRTWNR